MTEHNQAIIDQRNIASKLDEQTKELDMAKAELARLKANKLGTARYTPSMVQGTDDIPFYNKGKNYLLGYVNPDKNKKRSYHDTLPIVRWFYENDPIAGTV